MLPDWLPPQLALSGNSLQANYDELFSVYERDFINGSDIFIDGSLVINDNTVDRTFGGGVYTYGFTHLITKGKDDRYIDYDRAKKIPWVRAVIENYAQPEVTAFYINTPKGPVLYLWLVDFDFVVVLKKPRSKKERESNNKIIATAYHLQDYGRRDLQKLYGRSDRQL